MSVDFTSSQVSEHSILVELTTKIVSAYVGNNAMDSSEVPELISRVHTSLLELSNMEASGVLAEPAVPLRRHLRSKYDMSPEEYREKWNLPLDYPMVAPSYARQRSVLAKKMGLGQNRKTS